MKTLHNDDMQSARSNVSDLKISGSPGAWVVLGKASSEKEGWMKSTKAMTVPGGVLVQVSTQQRNPDGSYVVAEALTHVPNTTLVALFTEMGTPIEHEIVPL